MTSNASTSSLPIADTDVCVVSAVRTPLGCLGGVLGACSAVQLGSCVIKEALRRSNVPADIVDEVFFGNVLSAGIGQAPARQAALGAGIGYSTPCTTVNKVCSSGMKSMSLGAQSIMLGHNDIVVVGGMESMSQCPFYIPQARFGYRFGHGKLIDGAQHDGLWDPYNDMAMGNCGDICARDHHLTREDQDAYAAQSYRRAAEAQQTGAFADEIVPVTIKGRKGDVVVSTDEQVSKVNFEKMASLRPVFAKDGTVTAANASPISDGAAALVLVSGRKAKDLGITVIARVRSFADAAQRPEHFTTAPALAIPKALERAQLQVADVDFFEINEAFSSVALSCSKILNINQSKLNCFGGAIALGHPLGCSGARVMVTLLNVLAKKGGRIGCAGICNGGGGASAMVIELC